MKPQNAYKEIRRLVKLLAYYQEARDLDVNRLRLLQLVTEHPGVAYSVYQLHQDDYQTALNSCKLLFEPRVFDAEQMFFGWDHSMAVQIEQEEVDE